LLEPSGQFGTRLAGGKDAASSRYIFTRLAPYTKKIFDPSDNEVLKYIVDDGQQVEPEFYVPVIPMILINGAEGIGTGFSCYVPPFDPEAVKHNILCALDQVPMVPMTPFFKGFKGKITKTKDHTWVLTGTIEKEGSQLHITELPPGKWIQDFKEHLDNLVEKNTIQKYENYSTETRPDFRVWGYTGDDPVKDLGLSKTIHTSNMYLIGPKGAVKKYTSPEEILVDYIDIRVDMYRKRKAQLIHQLESEIAWIKTKREFITGVINGNIKVLNEPLEQVKSQLRKRKFEENFVPKLLDIKTYNYTQEEVQKLIDLDVKKRGDLEALKATSVLQMWKNNLSDL
jgi:DNA topoisomerase-2